MDVKQIAVERAIKMLDAVGAKYAILLIDGTKLGTLQVADPKVLPLRRSNVNKGVTAFVSTYMKPLANGQTATVPLGNFDIDVIQRAVAAQAGVLWGRGNFVTHKVADGVEVLRCA